MNQPIKVKESDKSHRWEKRQQFNLITKILHSTRFRRLEKLAEEIEPRYSKNLRVLDIGCGPARSYAVLKGVRNDLEYVGIEIREDFAKIASERYQDDKNCTIICDSIENQFSVIDKFDLIIGLETFEHIPEGLVVRVVENIAASDFNFLYVTVPNEVGPAIFLKNFGSFMMGYKRYKEYKFHETLYASIYELDKVARHGTGHKGFDWRWLAQTLRQNVTILKKTTNPVQFVPKFLSPSIGFICTKTNENLDEEVFRIDKV